MLLVIKSFVYILNILDILESLLELIMIDMKLYSKNLHLVKMILEVYAQTCGAVSLDSKNFLILNFGQSILGKEKSQKCFSRIQDGSIQ